MFQRGKKWLIGGGGLLALTLVLLAATAAHVAGLAQEQQRRAAARAACTPGEGVDAAQVARQVRAVLSGSPTDIRVPGLARPEEQIPNAKAVVAVGQQMAIPARGQVIALATALQESGLRNIDHGDRDSLGVFQQRPSQGWGSRAQIMNPVYASTRFYKALRDVQGWQSMPLTEAAQKVQKSGFPGAYAKHESLATALQQAIAPALGGAVSPPAALGVSYGQPACGGTAQQADFGQIPPGTLPEGYRIPAAAPPEVRTAIRWALGQLGTPYQWGGTCTDPHGSDPSKRCDCSSLTQRAYGVVGIQVTRTTYTQINDGRPVPTNALRPGDLVFSRGTAARPEHVAMVIGHGLLVHAPGTGRVVQVAEIGEHGQLLAARRLVG
jgi:cell wall-associated NlpC family hydrolase